MRGESLLILLLLWTALGGVGTSERIPYSSGRLDCNEDFEPDEIDAKRGCEYDHCLRALGFSDEAKAECWEDAIYFHPHPSGAGG